MRASALSNVFLGYTVMRLAVTRHFALQRWNFVTKKRGESHTVKNLGRLPIQLRQRLQLLRCKVDVVGVLCHFPRALDSKTTPHVSFTRSRPRPRDENQYDNPTTTSTRKSHDAVTSSRRANIGEAAATATTSTATMRIDVETRTQRYHATRLERHRPLKTNMRDCILYICKGKSTNHV